MIIQADILQWCEEYDGEPFHALLCDPPYHLAEIVRRFGGAESAPAQYGRDGAFQRASRGFMGKRWDGGDVAFRPETWAALARHLHPGAFAIAFASTKGYHRMACAIEDAGLIIHPMLVYAFGSGFPKATRIDTQIDRRAGAERKVVGQRKHQPKFDAAGHGYREKDNGFNSKDRESFDVTAPATELAAAWEGHRYGGQVLKPALEPICVFQKPYQGRPVDCITRTGAGALNVDGGRVGSEVMHRPNGKPKAEGWGLHTRADDWSSNGGRWPANLLLSHTPQCRAVGSRRERGQNGTSSGSVEGHGIYSGAFPRGDKRATGYADAEGYETVTAWACAEGCPVAALDRQSGERPAGSAIRGSESSKPATHTYNGGLGRIASSSYGDSGGASRFFQQSHWAYEIEERIAAADPVRYCAKASKTEREMGLDPDQIRLLAELYGGEEDSFEEDTIDDGREIPIDNPYQRGETSRRNIHPTVKPVSLSYYLAKLLLPPVEYAPRRLLIPFAGVASEYLGALFAGWEEIIGVELEARHCRIAEARIRWWQTMKRQTHSSDPGAILKTYGTTGKKKPSSPERWPAGSLFESLEVE